MMEQRQESGWFLNCQRSLKIKMGCTKDLNHHLFSSCVDVVTKYGIEVVLSE